MIIYEDRPDRKYVRIKTFVSNNSKANGKIELKVSRIKLTSELAYKNMPNKHINCDIIITLILISINMHQI